MNPLAGLNVIELFIVVLGTPMLVHATARRARRRRVERNWSAQRRALGRCATRTTR